MKKIIIFVLFLSTILTLTGCKATEGNVTPGLSDSAYAAEAEVQQLRAEIDDVGFWNSLDRSTDMIKTSLQTGRDISVGFRLATSEGETILLEDTYLFHLAYINDVWRSLTASQIEYIVAASDQVTEALDSSNSIKVTGTIMKWTEYVGIDSTPHIISVADIDADGKWDFAAEGKFYFTDSATTSIPGTENSYGAIGIIEVVPTDVITLNSSIEPTLSSMAKLALQG